MASDLYLFQTGFRQANQVRLAWGQQYYRFIKQTVTAEGEKKLMTNNVYIDLNVLQTVPSSNINRDDTGAPKTALYGGVTRSRVSSQSWKRAMRVSFKQSGVDTGTRTKEAAKLLANKLMSLDSSLDEKAALDKTSEVFKAASIKLDKNNETGALLLVSPGQIEKLAQYVIDHDELDKKKKSKRC